MSLSTVCDRCQKPFTDSDRANGAKINIKFMPIDSGQEALKQPTDDFDLCQTCKEAVNNYLRQRIKVGHWVTQSKVKRVA